MSNYSSLERVLKTIKHEEPDRVPHFEMLIDKKVRDSIMAEPKASYADFVERMDIDAIMVFDKTQTWSYETLDEVKKYPA